MSRFTFTGRLVQGDAHKPGPQRKDKRTNVLKVKKDGTPDAPFFLAVAVPKNPAQRFVIQGNPDYESQKAILDADARAAWPQYFGQRPQGLHFDASLPHDCINPKFANKVIDGDGYDDEGKPNAEKDGWAGCWIIKVSNGFAPKVYEWTAQGWKETLHTGRVIKCGDYVTISGDCSSNQSTESAGMYMNVDTVSFEQEGKPIIGSNNVDPNQALGSRGAPPNPAANQAGANAASSGQGAVGNQGSGTASEPYSGYRESAPPPPPSGPQMTAAATTSYDKYIAAGWTDAQLRANGLMV